MTDDLIHEGLFGDRGDQPRGRHYECPVCRQPGFGEQPPRCPEHPYREMEPTR